MWLKWGQQLRVVGCNRGDKCDGCQGKCKRIRASKSRGDTAIKMSAVIITPDCFMWRVLQTLGRNALACPTTHPSIMDEAHGATHDSYFVSRAKEKEIRRSSTCQKAKSTDSRTSVLSFSPSKQGSRCDIHKHTTTPVISK